MPRPRRGERGLQIRERIGPRRSVACAGGSRADIDHVRSSRVLHAQGTYWHRAAALNGHEKTPKRCHANRTNTNELFRLSAHEGGSLPLPCITQNRLGPKRRDPHCSVRTKPRGGSPNLHVLSARERTPPTRIRKQTGKGGPRILCFTRTTQTGRASLRLSASFLSRVGMSMAIMAGVTPGAINASGSPSIR